MSTMASQITSLTIVYSTVYSGVDQRKHQSSASLAFVRGIHRSPVNSPHKGQVTRKIFPFDDVIMIYASVAEPIWALRHGSLSNLGFSISYKITLKIKQSTLLNHVLFDCSTTPMPRPPSLSDEWDLWGPHRTLDLVHGVLHQRRRHRRRRRILTYAQLPLNIDIC